MEPAIAATALYAGLNAFVLVGLAVQTVRLRGKTRISIGDGGHPRLLRAMRGHANAIETVPMAIVLLALIALLGAPAWAVHVLGIALTVGRVLHGYHFAAADAPGWQRSTGTMLSALVLVVAAAWAIVAGLAGSV